MKLCTWKWLTEKWRAEFLSCFSQNLGVCKQNPLLHKWKDQPCASAMQQNDLLLKKLYDINMYAILCPIKATMACTVKRSTMSVCRPPARTTPPAGISSTPTSVSVHHSLKVRMRCRCVCVYVFQTKVHIYKSASRPHVTVAVFVCVCRQTLWSLQGSVSEDALPEWRSLRELRTQRFLRLPTWIPGWALASRSAWITDQLSISGDSIISDECQDMVNNCIHIQAR